jgi:hypothetical protein
LGVELLIINFREITKKRERQRDNELWDKYAIPILNLRDVLEDGRRPNPSGLSKT